VARYVDELVAGSDQTTMIAASDGSDMGIELLWPHPDEEWAVNCLVVRPGRVIMSDSSPRTQRLLERNGVEVVSVAYDEVQKFSGGVHCSTMELIRALPTP
jgi:arginine deiminase